MNAEHSFHRYPAVFIHGLFGWGEGTDLEKRYHYWGFGGEKRDLLAYLRGQGYEVYAPACGPVSSAWDRACELWAILVGGRVDYGKAHAARYRHARYGRVYPGLIPDWGEKGPHEKIDIFGHSLGGAAAIVFSDLVARGSEEERAATPPEELSPLFLGHPGRIRSVTTLSGVNNGTTFADFFGNRGMRALAGAVYGVNALVGDTPLMRLFDFDTDQWGIMRDPHSPSAKRASPVEKCKRIAAYNRNYFDHVGHEMQVAVRAYHNLRHVPAPDTYYFARRGCRTHDNGRGLQVPDREMRKFLKLWSTVIGRYRPARLRPYGFNDSWLPSDGIVNVVGVSAPFGAPQADGADGKTEFRPGLWYNMPVENKHHMSWVGIGESEADLFGYYDGIFESLEKLY